MLSPCVCKTNLTMSNQGSANAARGAPHRFLGMESACFAGYKCPAQAVRNISESYVEIT